MLVCAKEVGRLHRTASLRAQEALDHDSTTQIESPTIVADPVVVRNFINSIATLVDRYIASSTENNQVFVFVVAIIAYCTLRILLNYKSTLVGTQRVVALKVKAVEAVAIRVIISFCKLLKNTLVI